MIFQTNLAKGSPSLIGIMYQVHYVDNQFHYMVSTIARFGTHVHNFTKSTVLASIANIIEGTYTTII